MSLSQTSRWVRTKLALQVHLEAFCRFPRAYLIALKWLILRKRVRARGQFAILLSETSLAYQWWVLGKEASQQLPSEPGCPPLFALVDTAQGETGLERTLTSLADEHIEAFLIGSDARTDLVSAVEALDPMIAPWFLPMVAGDVVAPGTARRYRSEIEEGPHIKAIFADDDLSKADGLRSEPHFKPNWNAELYRHHDYLTGACIVQIDRQSLESAANNRDWARAVVDAALTGDAEVRHIPEILHHRVTRRSPLLPLPARPISDQLPRVSVIVPTRNGTQLLATCIAGLDATSYPNLEVIVMDNDSDDHSTLQLLAHLGTRGIRVIRHGGEFNYSAINNRAVHEATGELICLLNNDIEILSPNWLKIMATQAMRGDVGAVGAQLLYPDGRIQHAGVVIGVGNAAGHAHRFLRPDDQGYFRRHCLPQFTSAVTAACLVVQRARFLAVGGLDETRFKVAFNDVDLCLRLNARGWQSLYEPRAVLVHHESVSRGFDRDPAGAARFASELAALQETWATNRIFDPFHHPHLSRASEQFALALS